MGLFGGLFGGGKKPPKETTTTTVSKVELPPEVKKIITASTPYIIKAPGNYKPYAGDRVANLTRDQKIANRSFEIAGAQLQKQMNPAAIKTYQEGLSLLTNPFQNPAYGQAVDAAVRPIQDQFLQSVLPNIRTSSVGSGQYGGSRQDLANNIATQSYLREVGDTTGQLAYDTYNRGITAGLQTLALGPTVGQQLGMPGQFYATAGGVQQNQAQAEKNAVMDRYNERMLGPFQIALQSLQAANGVPGGSSSSSVTQPTGMQGGGGTGGKIMGAIGGAAQGFAMTGSPWGAAAGAVLSLFGS